MLLTCYLSLIFVFLYFSEVYWTPLFPLSPLVASSTGLLYHNMHNVNPVLSLICYLLKYPLQLCANMELNEQQEQVPDKLTLAAGQKYKRDIQSL